MTLDELRAAVDEGTVDTVLLALTDMRADEVRWNAMQIPVTEASETVQAVSAGPAQ